jgi:hypothetical protein
MGVTLCGVSLDARETGDVDEPVMLAEPGRTVTCGQCVKVIKHVRQEIRRGSYVVNAPAPETLPTTEPCPPHDFSPTAAICLKCGRLPSQV